MSEWKRVSAKIICRVCGHKDWCTYTDEGAACCMRTVSNRPLKNGGFLFIIDDKTALSKMRFHVGQTGRNDSHHQGKPSPVIDWNAKAKQYAANLATADLMRLATNLGLSHTSLSRLQVGHDGQAFTFPMQNANGDVVGIRRRLPDGKKLSVKGGHEGCFVPVGGIGDMATMVMVAEGPTDTAALLDAGFSAIGRPNCVGGVEIVKSITARCDVVILSDNDVPGERGAMALAKALVRPGRIVRVIYPLKGKDARAWHPDYATLNAVIKNTWQYQ